MLVSAIRDTYQCFATVLALEIHSDVTTYWKPWIAHSLQPLRLIAPRHRHVVNDPDKNIKGTVISMYKDGGSDNSHQKY